MGEDSYGSYEEMELHAFSLGFIDLTFNGRHLRAGPTIDKQNLFCSETLCHAGGIDRSIATADNGNAPTHLNIFSRIDSS
jgi:hypothetical protein